MQLSASAALPARPVYDPEKAVSPNSNRDPVLTRAPTPHTAVASELATFSSAKAYTDWVVKKAEKSAKWADKLHQPFEKHKSQAPKKTPQKHPQEWGEYQAQRWTAHADRIRAEQAIAAELRNVYQANPKNRQRMHDATHGIAQRYAAQVQPLINQALRTVEKETALKRNTSMTLYQTHLALGRWEVLKSKQLAEQNKAPGRPTQWDEQLKAADAQLQSARRQLMAAAAQEWNAEIAQAQEKKPGAGAQPKTEPDIPIQAAGRISERYAADAELAGALNAEWILREAQAAKDPAARMQVVNDFISDEVNVDATVRTLVQSDPRHVAAVGSYKTWVASQVPSYDAKMKQFTSATDKLRELTDPHKTDPLQATLVVQQATPLLKLAAQDFVDGAGVVADNEKVFLNLSKAADSALRASNLTSESLAAAGAGAPIKNEQLVAFSNPSPTKGTPQWMTELASQLSKKEDIVGYIQPSVEQGGGSFLPLEIARQLAASGKHDAAKQVIEKVSAGHDALEQKLRMPVVEYGELAAQVVQPARQWDPLLSKERQQQANKAWMEKPPAFTKQIDAQLDTIRKNAMGYDYLRSLEGFALHKDKGTFNTVLAGGKKNPFDQQFEDFTKDPQLKFGVESTQFASKEVFRIYNEYVREGKNFDPAAPFTPSGGPQDLTATEAVARGGAYATVGAAIGSLVFSQSIHGVPFTPKVIPIMTEQAIREWVLFSGLQGAFSGLVDPDSSQGTKYLANSVVTAVFSGFTVLAWDKGLGASRIAGRRLKNQASFRIPVSQKLLIFILPFSIPALGTFAIGPNTPKPPLGPDGQPLYSSHFQAMAYKVPEIANIAGQVTVAATLSGAYTKGGEALGLVEPGHWKRAPIRMKGEHSFLKVIQAGFRAQGLAGTLKSGSQTFLLVGANVLISGSVFGQNIDTPAGQYSLQNSVWGQAANVAMPAGTAMSVAGWLLAGSKVASVFGPAGLVLGIGGTAASIAFMAIDKVGAAAHMEGPTRERFYAAGFDRGFADILADHDDDGVSVSSRLTKLAELSDQKPDAYIERLQKTYLYAPNGKQIVRGLVTASHSVTPNDKGQYVTDVDPIIEFGGWSRSLSAMSTFRNEEADAKKAMLESVQKFPNSARQRLMHVGRDVEAPRAGNMDGLKLYADTYLPSIDELNTYLPADQKIQKPSGQPPVKAEPPVMDMVSEPKKTLPLPEFDKKKEAIQSSKEEKTNVYVVERGDHLWRIAGIGERPAKEVNKTYKKILELNPRFNQRLLDTGENGQKGRDPSALEIGDELILPAGYIPPHSRLARERRSR